MQRKYCNVETIGTRGGRGGGGGGGGTSFRVREIFSFLLSQKVCNHGNARIGIGQNIIFSLPHRSATFSHGIHNCI